MYHHKLNELNLLLLVLFQKSAKWQWDSMWFCERALEPSDCNPLDMGTYSNVSDGPALPVERLLSP